MAMITDVEDYFTKGCGRCDRFGTPDCSTRRWIDDIDELRTCDRVIVMFRGRVVAEHPAGWNERWLIAAMEGVDDRASD